MIKTLNVSKLAVLPFIILLTACSSTDPEPIPPASAISLATYKEGVPGGVLLDTFEVSAKVTAIDSKKRILTLKGSDGKALTVKVGPEAVNFDRIAVGDMVNATLTREVVAYIGDAYSSVSDGSGTLLARAPKGAQPAGILAETTQITGTVEKMDAKGRTATLRFEDGSVKTFPVRSDVDMSARKAGDKVVFRITEMIAIEVAKP